MIGKKREHNKKYYMQCEMNKILNKQSYGTFGRIKQRIKFSGRWQKPQANEWSKMKE